MTERREWLVVPAATARPQEAIAPRVAGSVRRSSHIALRWASGVAGDPTADLEITGAVSDIRTDRDGRATVVGAVHLRCTVAPDRTVTAIAADPAADGLAELVGVRAGSGWRARASAVAPAGTPLSALLDDVPIAVMLSSYGALRSGTIELGAVAALMPHRRDVCAGWADDASLMRAVHAGGHLPLPGLVTVAEDNADPMASEPRPPLQPGELRRARRLDVIPGEPIQVVADFRDVWHDPTLGAGALHEYVVVAQLSPDLVVQTIEADARVLPYPECSVAAASPQLLVGRRVDDVPEVVRAATGASTCTHLNDLLRTFVAVPQLLAVGG